MEDSDAEGTETEPLVNKRPDKTKRAPPPPPSFPSPHSILKPGTSSGSSHPHPLPPPHPHPHPPKPPKNPSLHPTTTLIWKAAPIDVSPSLQTLQEDEPTLEEVHLPEKNLPCHKGQHGTTQEGSYILCPFFGVRNYLQDFYEKPKDGQRGRNGVTTREDVFMVKRSEGLCSASIFRLSLLLGGIIFLMGATAFIVAACASRRATLIGKIGGVPVEDRVAAVHNAEVDALLLVGLIAVILGATVLASALITQAFCTTPNYEEVFRENLWSRQTTSTYEYPRWIYSIERRVPATEEVTQIQPSTQLHQGTAVSVFQHRPK